MPPNTPTKGAGAMDEDTESTEERLIRNSYEAMQAIYSACEHREQLPERLQQALALHQPLLEALTERVAP